MIETSPEQIKEIYARVSDSFLKRKTIPLSFRKEQLRQFWRLVDENEEYLRKCLYEDLRKPLVEAQGLEVALFKNEIVYLLENLDEYLAPEEPSVPESFRGLSPRIIKQPKGVALVIGAWNYPFFLSASPFLGVIASGCTGIMKPSEQAPATARALTDLVPKYLDNSCYAVVNGAAETVTSLMSLRWNHIFYTGGKNVGTIIATAAAKTLTPVTLELGGKCPVIVTPAADIKLAAKRIIWGKMTCAGQTCVAPDYAIVSSAIYEPFIKALNDVIDEFFQGDAFADGKMGRIINERNWDRVMNLLRQTKGKIVAGDQNSCNRSDLYIPPTIVTDVAIDDSLMSDEIFGPILPVMRYDTIEEACQRIPSISKEPLGLYVMSEDQADFDYVLEHTISGGVSLNDTMTQIAVPNLAFGGFGGSGMGAYHGKMSIDTFSHRRSVVQVPKEAEEAFEWRYPTGNQQEKFKFFKANLEAKL